jgi:hypothetical protein
MNHDSDKLNPTRVKNLPLYARYSSHMQRQFSFEDLVRACEAAAADDRRLSVADRFVSQQQRRGAAARRIDLHTVFAQGKSDRSALGMILIDDTSRLGRSRTLNLAEILELFYGSDADREY